MIPNGAEPALRAGIWYPSIGAPRPESLETVTQFVARNATVKGNRLPLIVISHGGGGSYAGHYDTAIALARAGFVVAAVNHAGDTHGDESRVLELWRRPAQLSRLIIFMLEGWRDHPRLDPERVGAFGFSNGGFTVLVAAGGVPDLGRVDTYCREQPTHDLCMALRQAGVASVGALPAPPSPWLRDGRIKAIAVAAPAFGFAFGQSGLRDVRIPAALWRAADDRHQPYLWYDGAVRTALPRRPEYHVVGRAGHYDFLAPCDPILIKAAPLICTSNKDFDRTSFHRRFNAALIQFFRKHLPNTSP